MGDLFKVYPNNFFVAIYEDISNNIDHGYCRPIPTLYHEPDHTYCRIHPVCVLKPMSPVNLIENDYYIVHGDSSFVNQELHKQNTADYALCSENNVRQKLYFRLD